MIHFKLITNSGKLPAFSKFPKPVRTSHVSSESSTRTGPHSPVFVFLAVKIPNMNFYTKLRKKSKGKKAKTFKKKLVTAGELFIASGLLTAGGNLVDSITGEDSSSTQISAGKVNWVNDQTRSLEPRRTKGTPPHYFFGESWDISNLDLA